MKIKQLAKLAAVSLVCLAPVAAQAEWPENSIKIVVPYNPGGTTDNMVRIIARAMEAELGQSVVVTNTAGGGGVVGMSAALESKADGYTVGMYLSNTLVGLATGAAPFTFEDIKPACMFSDAVLTITGIGGDDAKKDLADLLDDGEVKVAIERGTLSQFAGLMINEQLENDLKLVNAGTGAEKKSAVMGGHLTALLTPTAGVMKQHEAGQLKVLAVLSDERLPSAPDLQTAKEQGLDVSLAQSNGFMFPAGTPDEAVTGFCDALEKVVKSDAFNSAMNDLNVTVQYRRGEEYVDYMTTLYGTITDLARSVGYGN